MMFMTIGLYTVLFSLPCGFQAIRDWSLFVFLCISFMSATNLQNIAKHCNIHVGSHVGVNNCVDLTWNDPGDKNNYDRVSVHSNLNRMLIYKFTKVERSKCIINTYLPNSKRYKLLQHFIPHHFSMGKLMCNSLHSGSDLRNRNSYN